MSSATPECITVLVTCPSERAAELGGALVRERLAACVNIIAELRSIYTWKGELCDEPESLLMIKTRAARFDALRQRVVELHPYEVPEVIALPVVDGHAPYLQWIANSTD